MRNKYGSLGTAETHTMGDMNYRLPVIKHGAVPVPISSDEDCVTATSRILITQNPYVKEYSVLLSSLSLILQSITTISEQNKERNAQRCPFGDDWRAMFLPGNNLSEPDLSALRSADCRLSRSG